MPPIDPTQDLPDFSNASSLEKWLSTAAPRAAPPPSNPLAAGLRAGGHEALGALGSAAQAVGAAAGIEGLRKFGKGIADSQLQQAAATGRPDLETAPWEEGGGGFSSALPWAGYQFAKMIPSVAGMIAAGALVPEAAVPAALARAGAVAPRVLGGGGLRAGASFAERRAAAAAGQEFARGGIGAVAAGYPLGVGTLAQRAQDDGSDLSQGEGAAALAGGLPYAAVGAITPQQVRKMALGGSGKLVERMLRQGAEGAIVQGPQAAVQTAMEQQFEEPKPINQRAREIVNSALTGSILGGMAGGAFGIRKVAKEAPGKVSPDDLNTAIDQTISGPTPGEQLESMLTSISVARPGRDAMGEVLYGQKDTRDAQMRALLERFGVPGAGQEPAPVESGSPALQEGALSRLGLPIEGDRIIDPGLMLEGPAPREAAPGLEAMWPQATQADYLAARFKEGDLTPFSAVEPAQPQLSPFGELGGTKTPASTRLQLPAPERAVAPGLDAMAKQPTQADYLTQKFGVPEQRPAGGTLLTGPEPKMQSPLSFGDVMTAKTNRQKFVEALANIKNEPVAADQPWAREGLRAPMSHQLEAPRYIDKNGQFHADFIKRPYADVPTDELEATVQDMKSRHGAGKLARDDASAGVEMLQELKWRKEHSDSVKAGQKDLFKKDVRDHLNEAAYEKTREDLAGKVKGAGSFLRNLKAKSEVEALAQVRNMDLGKTKGAEALAKYWGVIDAEGKPRNLDADLRAVQKEKEDGWREAKATGQMPTEAQRESWARQEARLTQLKELHKQADAHEATHAADAQKALDNLTKKKELGLSEHEFERFQKVPEHLQKSWDGLRQVTKGYKNVAGTEIAERAHKLMRSMEDGTSNKMARATAAQLMKAHADAVQKSGSEKVDVRDQARNGEEVVSAHPEEREAPREGGEGNGPTLDYELPSDQAEVDRLHDLNRQETFAQVKYRVEQTTQQKASKEGFKPRPAPRGQQLTAEQKAAINKQVMDRIANRKRGNMGDTMLNTQAANADLAELAKSGVPHADLLRYVMETDARSDMRELAKALQRHSGKVPVKLLIDHPLDTENMADSAFNGIDARAMWDGTSNTMWLTSGSSDVAHDLLHETTHAVTEYAIEAGGPTGKRIQELFTYARQKLGYDTRKREHYGLKTPSDGKPHEFIAEAFSNPRFRALLNSIPSPDQPKKSIWQAIKDAVFKLLRLPVSARTLLDDVMDAGHQAMNEQSMMSPERMHEIFKANSEPDTPGAVNAHTRAYASEADRTLAQTAGLILHTNGMGWKALGGSLRRLLTGWHTTGALIRSVENIVPSVRGFSELHQGKDTLNARMNQMHSVGQAEMQSWIGTKPKEHGELLNRMRDYSAMGIDPRAKSWGEMPWLHKLKNAAQLKEIFEKQAQPDWNRMVQKGGAPLYEKLLAGTRTDRVAMLATAMHQMMAGTDFQQHFPAHTVTPGELYQRINEDPNSPYVNAHEDSTQALKFWTDHLVGQMKDVQAFLNKSKGDVVGKDTRVQAKALKFIEPIEQLYNQTQKVMEGLKQAPNFHLGRDGEYFVSGHFPMVDGAPDPKAVEALQKMMGEDFADVGFNQGATDSSFYMRVKNEDQLTKLHAIVKKAQELGHLDKEKEVKGGNIDQPGLLKSMAPKWMQQIIAQAEFDGSDLAFEGMSPEDVGKLKQAHAERIRQLKGIWMDMLPERNIQKMLMPRKGTSGYSMDFMHAYAKRAQSAANAISQSTYMPQIANKLANMRAETRALKSTNPLDAVKAHDIISELALRDTQRPWKVQSDFWDRVQTVTHSYFLGLNPAYAATQLSAVPLLLLPELTKKGGVGFVRAASAIFNNSGTAFKIMKAAAKGPHAIEAILTADGLKKAGVDGKTAAFILSGVNRGWFDLGGFNREMGSAARGDLNTPMTKFMKASNAMTIYAETYGRVLAALAARDVHGVDKEGLHDYAHSVVEQSMFNWNTWNNPRQMGKQGFAGPASPFVFKFMGYQVRMLEKMQHEVHDLLVGQGEDRKAAGKWIANHLAVTTMVAGSLGLPIAPVLAQVASKVGATLTGDEEYDVIAGYRNWLADTFGKDMGEVIARGVPRAAGVDLGKLGDADLIPFSKVLTDRRKFEDAAADWAKSMLGPTEGMGTNVLLGMREMMYGDIQGGMRKMAPTWLRNPMEAMKMWTDGYTDTKGVKLPIDAQGRDILAQAIGFTPAARAEYREAQQAMLGARRERSFMRTRIQDQLVKAAESGDEGALSAALEKANAFATNHPLNSPLPSLGAILARRQTQAAAARATGTPLGANLSDPNEQALLGFANLRR